MNRSLPNIPEEWIKQARLNDETAIERIYTTTFPKAYTIVYYSLGGTNKFKDEAQTITQDSLRKAFEKLDQLKEDNKFAPWMYTILNNSIRDYFRAEKRKNKDFQTNTFSELDNEDYRDNYEESIMDDSVTFSPEANMNTELIAEGLKECLDKLPDNQRFALMMQMYQQLTTKEIAEQMEVEENTVKSWIRRAKISIKDMIEELRRQNKSFYTVAPLPFLAWMLDQELKNIPSFNAKAFADGIVMKVKADTIHPQVKETNTTNTSSEHELLSNKKSDDMVKIKLSSESQNKIHKAAWNSVPTTGKVATGIVSKVVLGVVVFSLAAFGGYKIVTTKYNKSVESEKKEVTSTKQNSSNEKKKDGFEKVNSYKNGVYRMTADLPVYNTRSKEDTYGKTVYRDTPGGDEIRLIHGIYSDSDGNYWAKLREDKYVCVKDKDGEYIGEYLGDYIFVDDYVKKDYATYDEKHQDYVKYFTACGFEDPENVGGFGGSFPQKHDDQYNEWNYNCDGHKGTSSSHI